jgi:uncharacterized phage-associated protein
VSPANSELFSRHKGLFNICIDDLPGNIDNLDDSEIETIQAVLDHYADKSAQWLIDLTHLEDPWKVARRDCEPGDRCDREITLANMMDYYSGL